MDEKIIQLIKSLTLKTIMNKAKWNKTSRDTEFKLILSDGSITVDAWFDEERGEACNDFRLYNKNGDGVYSMLNSYGEHSEKFDLVNDLHSAAKGKFYKIDETIDSILKEVDSVLTVGETEF